MHNLHMSGSSVMPLSGPQLDALSEWSRLPPPSKAELAMLDLAAAACRGFPIAEMNRMRVAFAHAPRFPPQRSPLLVAHLRREDGA